MKIAEFKSLGVTKQLAYINRLEEIGKQKTALVSELEKENINLKEEIKGLMDALRFLKE